MRNISWCLLLCLGVLARAQNKFPTPQPATGNDEDGRTMGGVGLFIGAPSSAGLTGELNAGPFLLRLSGASWTKSWWGGQADLGLCVSRIGSLAQSIDVIAGRFSTRNERDNGGARLYRQDYVGAAYAVSCAGFLIEIGLGTGDGDFPNPQVIYQFGYLITF